MHRSLKLIPVFIAVIACAKTETPADTTAAMAPEPAPEMAPALTEADVAGTWNGTSTPIGSDSVISKWTSVCAAGSCRGTSEGSNVTVQWAYTISGDSSVGVSQPYSDPAVKGGMVIDTWVARVNGNNVTGTGTMALASKPDSVLMRYQFAGSR